MPSLDTWLSPTPQQNTRQTLLRIGIATYQVNGKGIYFGLFVLEWSQAHGKFVKSNEKHIFPLELLESKFLLYQL